MKKSAAQRHRNGSHILKYLYRIKVLYEYLYFDPLK